MGSNIALAGNPNSGKTTLFNALTGSNQFVGNWPGVTVEKKEGKLKGNADVVITDLPGIYSLSPYTLEEVVARNYLMGEHPDAILNIIDGTNLERNLYLTTQLVELGIPVVCAVNMMDVVEKNGDKVNTKQLAKTLGCQVVEISALKGTGITEAAQAAVKAAESGEYTSPEHHFAENVEKALDSITADLLQNTDEKQRRWYAVKIFERDDKVLEQLSVSAEKVDKYVSPIEKEMDDDSESIITGERYAYISSIIDGCLKKSNKGGLTTSDKIDKIVTNRILGLPIFAVIMFLVYYIAMVTVGASATDWANDGLFGDGWHLFGIGTGEYEEQAEEYGDAAVIVETILGLAADHGANDTEIYEAVFPEDEEAEIDTAVAEEKLAELTAMFSADEAYIFEDALEDEETLETSDLEATGADLADAAAVLVGYECAEPDPADYGVWVPGVPAVIESGLEAINCADWLSGLILDGVVAGVGAVIGFVPQMLVLFILLAFLESCGYMARIAFVLDRVFRRFGLSGKSFIPMLVGTGCGIPGIMASRTIENERDRRMTIMTTTFIPCGAKVPFIAMIAGAIFGGSPWVSTSAYFIGIAAIIISGVMLKKTKMFAGDPAPFVMELPAYHLPTIGALLRSMWERGWSFIKKAGTVILLSSIVIWFLSFFGFKDGSFTMLEEDELSYSILAAIGSAVAWIFTPLGWGNWQATVASVTGLVAKENIVATMGILYGGGEGTVYSTLGAAFTTVSGFSFLVFNLLCAPCFAAMGAIKREMNNGKWTAFAICYQCGFAYAIALMVNQFGNLFTGNGNILGTIVAVILLAGMIYMLFRPYKESSRLERSVKINAKG